MTLKVSELKAIYKKQLKPWKVITETTLVEMGEHSYFDIVIKKGRKEYLVCLKQKWFNSENYDLEEINLIDL